MFLLHSPAAGSKFLRPVPERCNNSIPRINMTYSGTFIPGIELLHLSGTGISTALMLGKGIAVLKNVALYLVVS